MSKKHVTYSENESKENKMAYNYFKQQFKKERQARREKTDDYFEEQTSADKIFEIEKLNDDFDGIAHKKGKMFVIKNALPGEKVEIKNVKKEEKVIKADIRRIIEPSEDRVSRKCKYADKCGACSLLHCSYSLQTSLKRKHLARKLTMLKGVTVGETVSVKQFGCRNKVHLVFGEENGAITLGFFNETTHKVVDVKRCILHGDWYDETVQIIKDWATENKLSAYKPNVGKGVLRFVVLRKLKNNIMATVVATSKPQGMQELYFALKSLYDNVSLYLSVNTNKTNEVMSGKTEYVSGEKGLFCEMLGVKFILGPQSFFQVNELVAEKAYEKIRNIIKTQKAECVIDAYSGIGITSMLFSPCTKQVISIEINPEAVDNAKTLISLNGIKNVKPLCGDFKKILPTLSVPDNTVFFVDPPRAGLGDSVVRRICAFAPKTIIYMSCNPDTLKSDLFTFTANGYTITEVTPFDMFPNTKHVETIVCLCKQ